VRALGWGLVRNGGAPLVDIATAIIVIAIAAWKRSILLMVIGCLKGLVLAAIVGHSLALGAGFATGHLLDVVLRKKYNGK